MKYLGEKGIFDVKPTTTLLEIVNALKKDIVRGPFFPASAGFSANKFGSDDVAFSFDAPAGSISIPASYCNFSYKSGGTYGTIGLKSNVITADGTSMFYLSGQIEVSDINKSQTLSQASRYAKIVKLGVTIDDGYRTLVYKPGSDVRLVNKAEYFDSIIADGVELQDGSKSGSLSVPTLTDGNVKVKFKEGLTSFSSCFGGCKALTSIPNNLFSKCTEATDFSSCFSSCMALTSIPGNLFSKCTEVTNFSSCFGYCSSLTTIPENLFANNTAVTDFSFCFQNCSSLTSIPENLFANNTAVTKFSSCFFGCDSLTSIPNNLFANNTKVTNFMNCFNYCSSLTSKCPTDNDGTPIYNRSGVGKEGYAIVTISINCFDGCTKMSDYASIPSGWK